MVLIAAADAMEDSHTLWLSAIYQPNLSAGRATCIVEALEFEAS